MPDISEDNTLLVSKLKKKIIELEKRETINVSMRIDESIDYLKEVLALANGDKILSYIQITSSPYKTTYTEGEYFSADGMVVTAYYEDGTSEEIYDYTYTPSGALETSDTDIIVSYQGKTALVSITVEQASNTVTLTYSSGAYADGGTVPPAVTVAPGTTVSIEFMSVPTRGGFTFAGWATTDGLIGTMMESEYSPMGTNTITLNSDVTLYPVFNPYGQTRTLTYSPGAYSDVSMIPQVPSQQMTTYGSYITVLFSPHPNKSGSEFVGWSLTDGQSVPEFSESGTTQIYMDNNYTLYPVYEESSSGYHTLTIDNSLNDGSIVVFHYEESKKGAKAPVGVRVDDLTVYPGGTDSFTIDSSKQYEIENNGSIGTYDVLYDGTYQGIEYNNARYVLNSNLGTPPSNNSQYWNFGNADSATITVVEKVNRITIDNTSGTGDITFYHIYTPSRSGMRDEAGPIDDITVYSGSSSVFEFTVGEEYFVRISNYEAGTDFKFNGVYGGVQYNDAYCFESSGQLGAPTGNSSWIFAEGDKCTLVSDSPSLHRSALTITTDSYQIGIYEEGGKGTKADPSYSLVHTVGIGDTYNYQYDPNKTFMLSLMTEESSDIEARFSGDYGKDNYKNAQLTKGNYDGTFEYSRFKNPAISTKGGESFSDYQWQITSGDCSFTLTEVVPKKDER